MNMIFDTVNGNRTLGIDKVVIAGYTARDQAKVQAHIDELKEIGVPAPERVPIIGDYSPHILTCDPEILVIGKELSGEVEFVLIIDGKNWWITLGSDHTDRKLEAVSIAKSKQVCAKPVAKTIWNYEEIKPHWDKLVLRSWVSDGSSEILYQEDSVATMLSPEEIVRIYEERCGKADKVVIFCGTPPLKTGSFNYSPIFKAELSDPVLNRRITLEYRQTAVYNEVE